eukprot:TRINITY_DN1199_c0_g1_i1.p1 TRINITY_DN1199_c0_g1~~TRINITY_DN1199_c0_g1_i1.p1  ORF type:complete len:788 (-),score=133.18 TRINITY_DN1199_c0_g1_i1:1441-3804(-)
MAPRLCPTLKHVPIGSCPHDVQCMPFGDQGSSLYRAPFVDVEDNKLISPWHDIALHRAEGHLAVVCSTPAGSWVRYELAGNEPFNPIRIRKATAGPRGGVACTKIAAHAGKTSHLAHFSDNAPWNHAFFPQTAAACTLHGTAPLQVLEIGAEIVRHTGEVYFVKPLGAIPVEEGQPTLTWKILAIAVDDPMASVLWDWTDMEEHLPGILDLIKDWLRTALCSEAGEKESIVHIQRPARLSQTLAKITEYHQTWKHFQIHRSDNVAGLFSESVAITPKLLEGAWRKYTSKDPYLSIPLHPLSTHVLFDDNWLTDAYYAETEEKVSERNALKAPPVSGFQKATRKILTFFNLTPSASNGPAAVSSAAASTRSTNSSPAKRRQPASRNSSFGSNNGNSSPPPRSVDHPNPPRKSHEGFVRPPVLNVASPRAPPRHRSTVSADSLSLPMQGERKERESALQNMSSEGTNEKYSSSDVANAIQAINKAQEEIERQKLLIQQSLSASSSANTSPSVAAAGARLGKAVEGQRRAGMGGTGNPAGAAVRSASMPAPPDYKQAPVRSTSDAAMDGWSYGTTPVHSSSEARAPKGPSSSAPQRMEKQTQMLAAPATAAVAAGAPHGEADEEKVDHTHDHTALLNAMRVAKMHEEKHKRHERHHNARHANSPKKTPPAVAENPLVIPTNSGSMRSGEVGRSFSGKLLTPRTAAARVSPASSQGSPAARARRAAARAAKKAREDYESHSESDTDSEDERWGGGEGGLKRRIALTRSLSYHEESVPRPAELDMLPKYDSE